MTFLKQLRRDPTSRFFGIPRDLTELLFPLCRPIQGTLCLKQSKPGWEVIGLTPKDEVVIRQAKSETYQIVSPATLEFQRNLDVSLCLGLWHLANGELVYLTTSEILCFRGRYYCFYVTNGRDVNFSYSAYPRPPGRRQLLNYNLIDITPEGKIYLIIELDIYEYDLISLVGRFLYSCLYPAFLKVYQNKIYTLGNCTLLIYDLVSNVKSEPYPGKKIADIAIDPLTETIYYREIHGTTLVCRRENEVLTKCHLNICRNSDLLVTRSGHLIRTNDDGIEVYS